MYTIGEISKMTDFSAHTLRYYDRIGLLPFVKRDEHGIRYFNERDLDLLATIRFMKDSDATTKEIRKMMELIMKGDESLSERLAYYEYCKKRLEKKLKTVQNNLTKVAWKMDYYTKAVQAGTEDIHLNEPGLYEIYYKKKK